MAKRGNGIVSIAAARKRSSPAATVAASNGRMGTSRIRSTVAGSDNRARPIGVFDSGIGGLTVLKELIALLPGARAAVKASRTGKIGVIGTEATIASGACTRAIQSLRPRAEIYTRACPLLVPLVEEGFLDNEIAEKAVAYYLESLKASGIDTLLLG